VAMEHEFERWQAMQLEASKQVAAWRRAHPRATFAEIERAVDEALADLRTQMLGDVAVQTEAAQARSRCCAQCHTPLRSAGSHERSLDTTQNRRVRVRREYGRCPACGAGLFPPR
jgi:uncharacterized protein with PIN domain